MFKGFPLVMKGVDIREQFFQQVNLEKLINSTGKPKNIWEFYKWVT